MSRNRRKERASNRDVERLVRHYENNKPLVYTFLQQVMVALQECTSLKPHVHSIKHRLKDPAHLREKLLRKLADARDGSGGGFGITVENLLSRINDLAGIRILHLHTRQIKEIDKELKAMFSAQRYRLVEQPFARTWDIESKAYFDSLGIGTEDSPSLYTSVHYVVESASAVNVTCEIQVRTLMEEVWGEVDHLLNYPTPNDHVAVREQLAALARSTSAASRLVDSIFATAQDVAAARGAQSRTGDRPRMRRN